jgi:hypothetical protein
MYIGRLVLLEQRNIEEMTGGKYRYDREDKELMQNFGRGTY